MPVSPDDAPLWATAAAVAVGLAVAIAGAHLVRRHPHEAWQFVRARFAVGSRVGLGLTAALVAVGVLFWAFTEVVESWTRGTDLYRFDAAAHRLAAAFASPAMTAAMKGATALGSLPAAVALTATAAVALRRRPFAVLALGLVMGPGEALVYGLKAFFGRVRPVDALVHAGGYSFPSGHSFTAAALYGFGIVLLWSRAFGAPRLPVATRVGLTAGLAALAIAVGASRIYLGVHFFTDVAGGFVLAAAWLVAVWALVRVLRQPAPSAS